MTTEQITQVLASSGLSPDSSDEQIRTTLLAARFTEAEVSSALNTVRAQSSDQTTRSVGTRKLFRSEQALLPHEISQLLGVEVHIDPQLDRIEKRGDYLSVFQYILVWFVSVVFAVSGILFYMYLNKVGLFHETLGIERLR